MLFLLLVLLRFFLFPQFFLNVDQEAYRFLLKHLPGSFTFMLPFTGKESADVFFPIAIDER